jgi:hypothetical protein
MNYFVRYIIILEQMCTDKTCKNDGKCSLNYGVVVCECTERFSGAFCELKIEITDWNDYIGNKIFYYR